MNPLQITLIALIVLIVVTALITYFVRQKYYAQIDELNQEKTKVLDEAPYDELEEVAGLVITGQSYELRSKLEKKWQEIESVKYPILENHLYEAEQATDRYRLPEAKKSQEAAEDAIEDINAEIKTLTKELLELIEREQANLDKIDTIKKRYHEVRKSLLARSFSFGPASDSFERKLTLLENDFTQFSEFTVSGDHEEANKIVESLHQSIEETEKQMEDIPPLLEHIQDQYKNEIEDLRNGYEAMTSEGFIFPEDKILDKIDTLEQDKQAIYAVIRDLDLEKAQADADTLGEKIDSVYSEMELEIEAKPEVYELLEDTKRAIYYLQEENRRLTGSVNRLAQSYILIHNEEAIIGRLEGQVAENRLAFENINEQLKDQSIPYSVAYTELDEVFEQLEHLHKEYSKVSEYLENYRTEEVKLKNDMLAMEQSMYEMKRHLENERLPGLPNNYLELFFSTSDRIELLSRELARPKIQLIEIRKLHKMCEEDVLQLGEMTHELVRQVELIERTSQRLYRYKDTHKGILETIRYSESLFTDDFDYETSLRMVREKLENVDPGEYAKVVADYEEETAEEN